MSTPSINDLETQVNDVGPLVYRRVRESLLTRIKRAAFWAAVVLPFLHVPLIATGLDHAVTQVAFVALLVANVIALLVGHQYQRE
jgi:hypothetical protein